MDRIVKNEDNENTTKKPNNKSREKTTMKIIQFFKILIYFVKILAQYLNFCQVLFLPMSSFFLSICMFFFEQLERANKKSSASFLS